MIGKYIDCMAEAVAKNQVAIGIGGFCNGMLGPRATFNKECQALLMCSEGGDVLGQNR